MTFGVQNNQEDAFQQMEYARSSCGVNFLDCAELYPVPLTASEWRAGATEEIVGAYLQHIGPSQRDDLVVATKVAGFFPSSPVAAARTMVSPTSASTDPMPDCRLDAASVKLACDASLRRLRTDRIDLFQIHWPDRYVPVFGQTVFQHDNKRDDSVPILETASALRDLIEDGKVRYIGISNESTFGVCEWIRATEQLGIRDKLVSIQNSYSLLDRRFDGELAEACDFHGLGLLPWSVLAGGLLSGKYRKNTNTASPSSRFIKYPEYMSRWSPSSASAATLDAVDSYAKIAADNNMSPTELAIAFARSRRFISDSGSVIVGATTLEQLKENLAPFTGEDSGASSILDDCVLEAIDRVHIQSPNPSCHYS
jgi:aryl-alcohol dehydrogenase-like predicted oxidoreductase